MDNHGRHGRSVRFDQTSLYDLNQGLSGGEATRRLSQLHHVTKKFPTLPSISPTPPATSSRFGGAAGGIINTMIYHKKTQQLYTNSHHQTKCIAPPIPYLPMVRRANVTVKNSGTELDTRGNLYKTPLFKGTICWEPILVAHNESDSDLSERESEKYDDNSAIRYIIKMRDELHWRTMLPRHGPGVRVEMKSTNHRNPMNEHINPLKDHGKYEYAIRRSKRTWPENPYDLKIISGSVARSHRVYYLVSATSVTRCTTDEDGKTLSQVTEPVMWWLYEARLFNMICHLKVFVNFRMWKQFQMWRLMIRKRKKQGNQVELRQVALFEENQFLTFTLFVRNCCEALSSTKNGLGVGTDAVLLFKYDSRKVYTLKEFCTAQEEQLKIATTSLSRFRDNIAILAAEVCQDYCRRNGIGTDVLQGLKRPKIKRYSYATENRLALSGKPVKVTYLKKTQWKRLLHRLYRFLRSLDFIVQDAITRVVYKAVEFFHAFILESNNFQSNAVEGVAGDVLYDPHMTVLYENVTRFSNKSGYTDWESVKSLHRPVMDGAYEEYQLDHQNEIDSNAEEVEDGKFSLNDPQLSDTDELEPEKLLKLWTPLSQSYFSVQLNLIVVTDGTTKMEYEGFNDPNVFEQFRRMESSITSLHKKSTGSHIQFVNQSVDSEKSEDLTSEVVVTPESGKFVVCLRQVILGYESVISQIGLISCSDQLTPYVQERSLSSTDVLPPGGKRPNECQEMFYQLGVRNNEESTTHEEAPTSFTVQSLYLQPRYHETVDDIFDQVTRAISDVMEWSKDFQSLAEMVDDCKSMSIEDRRKLAMTWEPAQFADTLYHYTDIIREIHAIRRHKRVCMFDVDTKNFTETVLKFPQEIVDMCHEVLPKVAIKRNDVLVNEIHTAISFLSKETETVEEFVSHLTFLAHCTTDMKRIKEEYVIVNKIFKIIKDYDIEVAPQKLAIFSTLNPAFNQLKSTLVFYEDQKDDSILKFTCDLDKKVDKVRSGLFSLYERVQDPKLLDIDTPSVQVMDLIYRLCNDVEEMSVNARNYVSYQERFGHAESGSSQKKKTVEEQIAASEGQTSSAIVLQNEIAELERDVTMRKLLWESNAEWEKLHEQWLNTPFKTLNIDHVQENVSRFIQTIFMLEKGIPVNGVLTHFKTNVTNFKQGLPLIAGLRNGKLLERHWEEIQYIIGRSVTKDDSLTLGELMKWRLAPHRDSIIDISARATNEATLLSMLERLSKVWKATDFKLTAHQSEKGRQQIMVISQYDELYNQLEESQMTISTIKGSRYVEPIKNQVDDWDRRLMLFARTLNEWIKCQRLWLYLEPVFTTSDIQRQLAIESRLFNEVDVSWIELMKRVQDRPNALKAATGPGVLETLQSSNSSLEKVKKSLDEYLELKRLAFSRFYFLSNDELLSILSRDHDPLCVQPHLAKCFSNIKCLKFTNLQSKNMSKIQEITSMTSAEGEEVEFQTKVKVRGSVETWLSVVESSMFDAVRKSLNAALASWNGESSTLTDWMYKNPGQIVLVIAQILFNDQVSAAISSGNAHSQLDNVHSNVLKCLNVLSDAVSDGHLVSFQYYKVEALIITYVHIRDIIINLMQKNITSTDDFQWKKQLLYKFQKPMTCRVDQAQYSCGYGYEYIGCSSRLVITPLTDRCFLTLTGALSLHLGGSPAGPAGTGKSETVKDLAKNMGKQCVVFNCSEGIDYKTMGQFFSGLSQSGSWCCFDEFNRIDVEVLSVIASQVHAIKSAKDANAMKFMFEGREIKLNPSCGYFITMNPGYLGRVELPDNLKSLFRPVAMMIPDSQIITEITLFSEGFRQAKLFSRKIVNLYELTSKQLSQQDHYDFGMRSIKSVLVMAGHKKREMSKTAAAFKSEQKLLNHERDILIHSITNANLPRFLAEDAPLFKNIMSDLFPGVSPPNMESKELELCIEKAIKNLGFEHWPSQVQKVVQLNEQLNVRHGVMLVGPSGGGKTTVRTILKDALMELASQHGYHESANAIGKAVQSFSINPKCISIGELYGYTNPNTLEWSDGLFSNIVRRYSRELTRNDYDDTSKPPTRDGSQPKEPKKSTTSELSTASRKASEKSVKGVDEMKARRWVILDGPVDTTWVENLNTALDDTRTLCLSNGERIGIPENLRLMFEVDSLTQASPATISRCAMVYMDPIDLGWKPYVKSWIRRLPKTLTLKGRIHLWQLFVLSVDEGLHLIDRKRKLQQMPVTHMQVVQTLCRILGAFFTFMKHHGGFGVNTDESLPMKGLAVELASSSRARAQVDGKAEKQPHPPTQQRRNRMTSRGRFGSTPNAPQDEEKKASWFMETHDDRLEQLIGRLFVFAFTWSFGGVLNREDDQEDDSLINTTVIGRDEELINVSYDFDQFVHDIFENHATLGVTFPSGSKSIFSYFVDLQSGRFVAWNDLVPGTKTLVEKGLEISPVGLGDALISDPSKASAADIAATLVPTADTIRYSFLVALLLLDDNPVMLAGDSGVGKLMLMQNILSKLSAPGGFGHEVGTILGDVYRFAQSSSAFMQNIANLGIIGLGKDSSKSDKSGGNKQVTSTSPDFSQKEIMVNTIQFSALTQSTSCQNHILSKLVKKSQSFYGPPKNKQCIAFINDLNMPMFDKHGSQAPLELLRQFIDMGGFYDLKTLSFKSVEDVTLATVAAPPGSNKNKICPRFLTHFSVFVLPQPSTTSLQHIYRVQLGTFLNKRDFMPDVKSCCNQIVNASIAIYYKMCNAMLPTPEKSHYTFNLRDATAVIKGVMQANEAVIVTKESVVQLFANETLRIYHDRLTDAKDRLTFHQFLSDDLHNYFKVSMPPEELATRKVNFGDFLESTSSNNTKTSDRVYRQLPPYKILNSTLEEFYMRVSSSIVDAPPLVFFEAAIDHVIRAARVFRQPGAHLLMVGIDGTGKATSCKLAAQLSGCQVYRLNVVRGYSFEDFREELKKVLKLCGVRDQPMIFLLTDSDIVSENFLEDINCILNTGEDADLFDNEELDAIIMEVKQAAVEANVPDLRSSIVQFFRRRVSKNLHFAIAMSPAGGSFRKRSRTHPALVNCCTIDWYDGWPDEALVNVAVAYFSRGDFLQEGEFSSIFEANDGEEEGNMKMIQERGSEITADNIAHVCVQVHAFARESGDRLWKEMHRKYYTTPATYLEFVQLLTKLLSKNREKMLHEMSRLRLGMHKIAEANEQIRVMQKELVELGPKMEQHSVKMQEIMDQLSKDTVAVNEVREIVMKEEEAMKLETAIVQDFANAASDDLKAVLPALQEAVSGLDSLDKSAIAEIRVYTHPPELVLIVMQAVCLLLRIPTNWGSAKMALSDPHFLKNLVQIDRDDIPDGVFVKLAKITCKENFIPEQVSQVSHACMSLCKWVLALEHYHNVQKMIVPKQERVKESLEALEVSKRELEKKQLSLERVETHFTYLNTKFKDSLQEQEEMNQQRVEISKKMERATQLIQALKHEEARWKVSMIELKKQSIGLVGDTLCSAASVAYLGPFPRLYRQRLTKRIIDTCRKTNLLVSANYSMVTANTSKNQVRNWHNMALPRDGHSVENAVIIDVSRRWPLIIDPQGQASNWIKQMEKDKLRIVYAGDANCMKAVERAIRVGDPLLLYDVGETLDAELRPVLQREVIHRTGQDYICIGGTEVSYNNNFRLYLTTSKTNPHFLPAVCISVTIVNFTITFEGLQGQLLSSVIRLERPQLEEQRTELLISIASDTELLQNLEDQTLQFLEKQKGSMLEHEDLINILRKSHVTSQEVSDRLSLSETNELRTDVARRKYLPVATRGAVLYFVIADLEGLNPMYQFSLQWFTRMFVKCIVQVNESSSVGMGGSATVSDQSSTVLIDASTDSVQGESGDNIEEVVAPPQQKTDGTTVDSSEESIVQLPASLRDEQVGSNRSDNLSQFSDDDEDLNLMLQNMVSALTRGVYKVVSYCLFAQHQIIFSFLLVTAIMRNNAKFEDKWNKLHGLPEQHWNIFLHTRTLGSMISDRTSETNLKRPKEWVSSETWQQCRYLSDKITHFRDLCELLSNSTQEKWERFRKSVNLYKLLGEKTDPRSQHSLDWSELTQFERLILIKVLRPECLPTSIRQFVEEEMGPDYLHGGGGVDLSEIYQQSQQTVPLIFILSPGTDPSAQLLRYAKDTRGSILHVDMVSLGRGQGPKAENLIQKAQILKGRWVFLQNCHLAASFMPRLQAIVEELSSSESKIDPDFRLWLSSKPDSCFPVPILQKGLKMSVEPARGVRSHLQQAFGAASHGIGGDVSAEMFDGGSTHPSWRPLLFALCCFNALSHERQKFGTLGFNLPYDFTSSDLEVAVLTLQQMLGDVDSSVSPPWSALQYLTGEVIYGGRVTDEWDRRCLVSTLTKFLLSDALTPKYSYSLDNVFHSPPPDITHNEMCDYVNSLPVYDPPDLFGMHENAEITYMKSETTRTVETIIAIQPKLTQSDLLDEKSSDNEIVMNVAQDILKRLPPTVESDESMTQEERDELVTMEQILTSERWISILNKSSTNENEQTSQPKITQSALLVVARQEIDRFNRLLDIIRANLLSLVRALTGEIVMSEHLEITFNALMLQKVPATWKSVSYESCKLLGSWFTDLLLRIEFFKRWSLMVTSAAQAKMGLSQKDQPTEERKLVLEPTSFWLSAFFFPQGFLTAVLQNYARKYKLPVDTLSFRFDVQEASDFGGRDGRLEITKTAFRHETDELKDGVRIFGLYLDSARLNDDLVLCDAHLNNRFSEVPEIHFVPTEIEQYRSDRYYRCPLYRTSSRAGALSSSGHSTNFVTTVNLASTSPADYWILCGTALLCQLDD